jgi:hypothetical protein
MPSPFKVRFATTTVLKWAARYAQSDEDVARVGEAAQSRGHLEPEELQVLARWKTPRTAPHIERNGADFVREVTRCALSTRSERLRIEVLTLLDGVDLPTASVILHFAHPDPYPILDYRALWAIGSNEKPPYSFEIWEPYVAFTRATAQRLNVSMRKLDRALWQFSKERQREKAPR